MIRIIKHKAWVGLMILLVLIGMIWNIISPTPPGRHWLYLNVTNSEPIGLYRITDSKILHKGDYVLIKPPPSTYPYIYGRGWLPKGWLLLKTVAALPGDTVRITERAIYINGQWMGPIFTKDSNGLQMPRLRGQFGIKNRCLFVLATNVLNSFDGRYFGPLNVKLAKRVHPVLIWK